MVRALTALYRARPSPEYVAIACLIACYIDALAANGGNAGRGKFTAFLKKHFKPLCDRLASAVGGKRSGAEIFYEHFRDKMVHNYFTPNAKFALAEDHELHGQYAGELEIDGRKLVAINIERLYREFVALARKRAKRAKRK